MAYLGTYDGMVSEIQLTGKFQGKAAKVFNIIGRRSTFTSTSLFNDIGDGITTAEFPILTGAEAISIISTNINDDGAPVGTGARTVKVTYIDTNYAIVTTADITLNGTTSVSVLASGMLQFLWMENTTVGSTGAAVGNIELRYGGGAGTIFAQITALGNKSMNCIFMIPDGYTGYVDRWAYGNIANSQDFRLRAQVMTHDRTLSTVYHFQGQKFSPSNTTDFSEIGMLQFPARCKIKVSTISSSTAATTRADAKFIMIIIAN